MLTDAIKLHGRKQIEIKQKIRIAAQSKKLKYRVDNFFIFPGALQITENNFKKEEFKRNLKCYLSLSETSPSLETLFDKLSEPLQSCSDINQLSTAYKRFGLRYKSALQERCRALMETSEPTADEVDDFLRTVGQLLEEFRKVKSSQTRDKDVGHLLDCLDEFLTVETAFCLRDLSAVFVGENRTKILSHWRDVEDYRQMHFPYENPEGESKESAFLLRWSHLKKFVHSCLYLDIRYKAGAPLLTHSIYGSAAALSMLFATIVAFFYQDLYGSLSRNLFFAFVIAYIFKDRFKEIFRDWLSNVIFRRWIPDRRLFIFMNNQRVGSAKENFGFVRSEELPLRAEDLIRDASRRFELSAFRPDSVFRYSREVSLSVSELPQQTRLIDIVRFNISEFLHNLGAKSEELPFFSEDGKSPKGEKLYNIYLLRVFSCAGRMDSEVIRITVNAKSVRRISIVKAYEVGNSVIENRGKFIYT